MRHPRRFIRPILAGIGAALLIVSSLVSNLQLLRDWSDFNLTSRGEDGITKFDERFDTVKTILPRGGVAGFITDRPDIVGEYYLTQYSLAPLLLEPNKSHEFVLSLYRSPDTDARPAQDYRVEDLGHGMQRLDFGNGIRLYRNEQQ